MQTDHSLPPNVMATLTAIAKEAMEDVLRASLWVRCQCIGVEEAAQLLQVDDGTIRAWIKAGKLPASKIGKDWTIRMIDVNAMLVRFANTVQMDNRFKRRLSRVS